MWPACSTDFPHAGMCPMHVVDYWRNQHNVAGRGAPQQLHLHSSTGVPARVAGTLPVLDYTMRQMIMVRATHDCFKRERCRASDSCATGMHYPKEHAKQYIGKIALEHIGEAERGCKQYGIQ